MPLSKLKAASERLRGRRGLILLVGLLLVAGAVSYKLVPRIYNGHKLNQIAGRKVYDENVDATRELERALELARQRNKRVLVVLGGNWCKWCLTLDSLIDSDPELKQLFTTGFVALKLDADAASDWNDKWGKPTELGVPVMVFLDPDGSLAHVQNTVPLEMWGGRLLAYDRDDVYAALEPWAR